MRRTRIAITLGLLGLVAGCDALLGLFSPTTVTLVLVNESPSFRVDGTLVYAEDELPEALLDQLGTELDFDLAAGTTQRITRDCDALRSVRVKDADLRVILGISPDTDSDVQFDGEDFDCGDQIVFRFTHSEAITDFDVRVTVVRGSLSVGNP